MSGNLHRILLTKEIVQVITIRIHILILQKENNLGKKYEQFTVNFEYWCQIEREKTPHNFLPLKRQCRSNQFSSRLFRITNTEDPRLSHATYFRFKKT